MQYTNIHFYISYIHEKPGGQPIQLQTNHLATRFESDTVRTLSQRLVNVQHPELQECQIHTTSSNHHKPVWDVLGRLNCTILGCFCLTSDMQKPNRLKHTDLTQKQIWAWSRKMEYSKNRFFGLIWFHLFPLLIYIHIIFVLPLGNQMFFPVPRFNPLDQAGPGGVGGQCPGKPSCCSCRLRPVRWRRGTSNFISSSTSTEPVLGFGPWKKTWDLRVVTVTTRIITVLHVIVGDTYKPLSATVTGGKMIKIWWWLVAYCNCCFLKGLSSKINIHQNLKIRRKRNEVAVPMLEILCDKSPYIYISI